MGKVTANQMHFLGVAPVTNEPILVPIDAFTELAWLVGPMGSGKTVAMIQLAERLIGLGYSVLFMDLKGGSHEIVESLHIAAQMQGVKQKVFSNSPLQATHAANLFSMPVWQSLSRQQQVYFLLRILGVEHDLAKFGEGFFTTASSQVASHAIQTSKAILSFKDLSHKLSAVFETKPKSIPQELLRHGAHVLGAANRLAEVSGLNIDSQSPVTKEILEHAIDFATPFVTQQVWYVHLPATRGGQLAGELAGYIMHGLAAAAEQLRHRNQVFLFIDEHQVMASPAINTCLAQFRSLNVGVILANQTPSQIQNRTVLGNLVDGARFRQWFGMGLDTQLWFEARSGQRLVQFETKTITESNTGASTSLALRDALLPYLSINDLKRVTGETSLSVYEVVRGTERVPSTGFAGVAQSFYTCSYEEYVRRQQAPWPRLPGMFDQLTVKTNQEDLFPGRPSAWELDEDY